MTHRSTARIALFLWISGVLGCTPKTPIDPPVTPPLSRSVLGYGIVTVAYTRIFDEPRLDSVVLGNLREKTILTVLERRLIKEGDDLTYWLLTEGDYRGWLPGSVITLYDTEGKAQTAASR